LTVTAINEDGVFKPKEKVELEDKTEGGADSLELTTTAGLFFEVVCSVKGAGRGRRRRTHSSS
jgi:predicted DNA-binding antitoxin AbrB/MazE fold protein